MRGLPGSGKSTLAKKLTKNVYSADDYFIKDGKYLYDYSKIAIAHEWNKDRIRASLEKGVSSLAVDNTNTSAWEMRDYVKMGIKYDYDIVLVEPDTDYKWDLDMLKEKSKHNIDRAKLELMRDCYSHDPSLEDILKAEKE